MSEPPQQPPITDQTLLFAQELAAERAKSRSLLARMSLVNPEGKRVLVADDDPALRIIVSTTLEGDGYQVFEAKDGAEALAQVYELHPDVVLLDVDMPGLNGLEVCRHIRSADEIKDTRVVMLSARSAASEKNAGIAAGANLYLTKPFKPTELLQAIRDATQSK